MPSQSDGNGRGNEPRRTARNRTAKRGSARGQLPLALQRSAGALTISPVDSLVELKRLEMPWWELVRSAPRPSYYNTPGFLLPWAEWVASAWTPHMTAVHRGRELIGLVPLFHRSSSAALFGLGVLGFPVQGPTPPFEIVAAPNEQQAVADALMGSLLADRSWSALWLPHLDPRAPTNRAFLHIARRRLHVLPRRTTRLLGVDTARGTFAAFSTGPERTATKAKEQHSAALDAGRTWRVRVYPQDAELPFDAALDGAAGVVRRSTTRADVVAARLKALRLLALAADQHGALQIHLLEHEGKVVSLLVAFRFRRRLQLFSHATAHQHSEGSPHVRLLLDAIERSFVDETQLVEFGAAFDDVQALANWRRPDMEFRAARSGFMSRAHASAYFRFRDPHRDDPEVSSSARR